MTVYTTAPALQFYSGNYLEGTTARNMTPTAPARPGAGERVPARQS